MKFKKIFRNPFFPFGILLFAIVIARAATVENGTNVTNLVIDGTGIYDSSGTLKWNPATNSFPNNVVITGPSDLYMGAALAVVSATTTAGTGQGLGVYTAFLRASSSQPPAIEGSVLCSTDVTLGTGLTVDVCNATNGLGSVVGVAMAAASTGTLVNVASYGWVFALTTGTVRAGDMLITTALSTGASGYLQATSTQGTVSSTNTVAVALQAGISAGGLTRVKLGR